MQLKHLTLTHVRAFEQAGFAFQPGMNLIVGINGVGKSTVLDALRILLSQVLPKLSHSRSAALEFEALSDITIGQSALTAQLSFEAANTSFNYLVHKPADRYYVLVDGQKSKVRKSAYEAAERHDLTPEESEVPESLKTAAEQPLAVYFSPRRAIPDDKILRKKKSEATAAFVDALEHRELRLMEFADWWLAQKALAEEGAPLAQHYLDALSAAVNGILDTCSNFRAVRETFDYKNKVGKGRRVNSTTLLVDKGDTTIDIRYLSDGERGMLALVLDLTRRLAQANPKLREPLKQGKAVVLIDEIDLHLHPRWQRSIVEKLTTTFPNCQFIATTHSPQTIGEVPPKQILILEDDVQPYRPDQSLGMDTNWILRHIMGAETRDAKTRRELEKIRLLIADEEYEEATDAIDELRDEKGEFAELVGYQTRIDRIRILGE